MLKVQKELRQIGSPQRAEGSERFFKTGRSGYAADDVFIGVTVPETRALAKKNLGLSFLEIQQLLKSPVHEDRLLGLMVCVENYQKSKDQKVKREIVQQYLKIRAGVNNWDLVDLSAYKILGDFCFQQKDPSLLRKFAKSNKHWERRIAMVSTFAFIRQGEIDLTFELCRVLLQDKEDLMHKACGWMLREAGKRNSQALESFIKRHGAFMPRTMLRYSIERMPEPKRLRFLNIRKEQ